MDTVVVNEKRSFIDKIRAKYQEKVVDTGGSLKIEEQIEKQAEMTKKTIAVAGTIATIVLLICPADGPVGEICTALATPALIKLVDVVAEIKKKALISGKRSFEKNIMKVSTNGTSKSYDLINNPNEAVADAQELKDSIDELVQTLDNGKGTKSL